MAVLLSNELNNTLTELFNSKMITIILATLDQDLHPHTAPFNYIAVRDSKHICLAISKYNQTYANIVLNGYVALAILEEGDMAVGIKGMGRIIVMNMESDYSMAVLEVEIYEVKKDNSPTHYVTQGIRIRHKSEPFLLSSRKIFQELTRVAGNN